MLKRTLVMNQGETYNYTIRLLQSNGEVYDPSNWTAVAQMRKHSESSTYYSFATNITDEYINLSMSAFETSLIPSGSYLYDVELTSGDQVIKVMSGIITVFAEITK